MKKAISKIIVLSMLLTLAVFPQTASAASVVTLDSALTAFGFIKYNGTADFLADCTVVDSEDSSHGEVLQIYAQGNVDRSNRYGGVQFNVTLESGKTYRFECDYKNNEVTATGTDTTQCQLFTSMATSTHGTAYANLQVRLDSDFDWHHKSFTVKPTSTAVHKVQLGVAGNFVAWFDNVEVYDTSDATRTNLLPTKTFATAAEELAAPTNLEITSHNYGEATLSWNAVSNASGYKVSKSVDEGSIRELATVTTTSLTVTNTTGKNTYYVQALGDNANYIDGKYAALEFEEALSKLGIPQGYRSMLSNASGGIIVTWEQVVENGDNKLRITQQTSGANGDDWGGIRYIIDPSKLVKGHTYYFGFDYKKDSLNDAESTAVLAGFGNNRGSRLTAQQTKGDALEWAQFSRNNITCTNVENFGIDIIVKRNAAMYIDNLQCFDLTTDSARKHNLIENGDFEQKAGSTVADAENIMLTQGLNSVAIKWDYPSDTLWQGAEIWDITEDFEMLDEDNKTEIQKSSENVQAVNVPAIFGEVRTYKLILVDAYGNKSEGIKIIATGMDESQNAYNFANIQGWTIAEEDVSDPNENAPIAMRPYKSYNTDTNGALYVSQTKGDTPHWVQIKQEIPCEAEKTYVLSYDVKGTGATDPNKWRSSIRFAHNEFETNGVVAFADVAKPYWTTQTIEYTTGAEETSVIVNMIFRSSCELWLDNIAVYAKDDANKTNLLVNGSFETTSSPQAVQNAQCMIVDDEYLYLGYELEENSGADKVLLESADGTELYAMVDANIYELDLNALFIEDGEIPEELKLTVCDIYGNKSESVNVSTVPYTEIGEIVVGDTKATMSVINQTEANIPIIMLAAVYDSTTGALLGLNVGNQNNFTMQDMGDAAYTAEVTLPVESGNLKVFAWNTLYGMKPVFE